MKRICLLATCLFVLGACADAPEPDDPVAGDELAIDAIDAIDAAEAADTPEPQDPATRAQLAVDAATDAYAQSQEAGHAWQATRLSLEAAQGALERGEYELAETQAQRALQIAEASLAQARTEAEAWQASFPAKPLPTKQ